MEELPPNRLETDDRGGETPNQRMDRNWVELLQELRVIQTGIQILAGFLLTLPFQQKFTTLDNFQRTLYLALVLMATSVTALFLSAVTLHRALFRHHIKDRLVSNADRLLRLSMSLVGLILAGTASLIFDIVLGRFAGILVGVLLLLLVLIMWVIFPLHVRNKNPRVPGSPRH